MNQFDVQTVTLKGKNLIEASAGTGKTYSVAVLVLRVLLETDIKIKELLLVTFTDAAVAELDERVRIFLRTANRYLEQSTITEDTTISTLVDRYVTAQGKDVVAQKLKDALIFLDEVQITTIHGFCNHAQKQFAFETHQLFEKELIADQTYLLEQAINEYWRTEITGLPIEYLQTLFEVGFGREEILSSVKNSLSGKVFRTETGDVNELFDAIIQLKPSHTSKKEEAFAYVPLLADVIPLLGRAKPSYEKLKNDPIEFVKKFCGVLEANTVKYIDKFPTDFIVLAEEINDLELKIKRLQIALKGVFYQQFIDFVTLKLETVKKQKSLMSYDDMITGLHKAVTSVDNERLIKQLKKHYKVVFIDEFQDTDRVQYDIFYEAFGNEKYDILEGVFPTTVFYIGDPKQSIYAFRQANLKTYSLAKESSQVFDMDTNFRSVPDYVEGMNAFFEPHANFPFFKDERIKYIQVKPSSKWKTNQEFTIRGIESKPFSFTSYGHNGKDKAYNTLVAHILETLKDGKIDGRIVVPEDIGILVRTGKQAKEIKAELSKYNVPAVVVDDSQVLKSKEAKSVRYILEAILDKDRSNINRAMLTPFTSYNGEDLARLDVAEEMMRFSQIIKTYADFGVYPALMNFMEVYDTTEALKCNNPQNTDRSLSNFIQLAEICNERQLRYNEDLAGLITWMCKEYERKETSGTYEQRLESDRNAVNIVTIHKSKGLDYNIVFTFFPSSGSGSKNPFVQYQNPETGLFEYAFNNFYEDAQENKEIQEAQEMMRLWYVAITRAVYKSYIYYEELKKSGKNPESKIIANHKNILAGLENYSQFFEDTELNDLELEPYVSEENITLGSLRKVDKTIDFRSNWAISSYSSIRKKEHHALDKTKIEVLEGYDEFVFHQMPRGASVGNFLHLIFEEISYDKPELINDFLTKKIGTPFAHRILSEDNISQYETFVNHVLHAELKDDKGRLFNLTEVKNKLPEMEFFFNINDFSEQELREKFTKPFDFQYDSYTGYVNGFIDLTFEFKDRYYILDWKSNHLGDTIEEYNGEGVELAMTTSNYHLQYFIYTISLCRYLRNTLAEFDYDRDFGGVFYVFLRGCRAGKESGIFYFKPSWKSIKEYL